MLDNQADTVRQLCDSYRPGMALGREFYASEAIYQQDIRAYWNTAWIWVGHVCQIPEPGDFFLFDYGPESIIIARDREGQVGAFLNVCRHRGSRVCTEQAGHTRVFSCPYHAWTYELNGRLRAAKHMDADFDPSEYGLFAAHVRVFEGLIFICTADEAPDIEVGLNRIGPLVTPYRLAEMKVAHEASYPVPANWKLAVENYMECYHCAPAHLDYSRSHSLKDPASITEELKAQMDADVTAAGLRNERVEMYSSDAAPRDMDFYFGRYPLYPGYQTGSESGEPLAPLLGDLKAQTNSANDMQIGMLNNFLIYGDHMVGYRFVPRSVQESDIQMVWYVRADAEEGVDYDREALTWLWHVTTLDDERIIRVNQEGVNSHHFTPGPLGEMERGIRAFYAGYLHRIGSALPAG